MSFDLLDDIMLTADFDRDISFSDLIVDDDEDANPNPIKQSSGRGMKRDLSSGELVQCATQERDDGITVSECNELNEFLQGIGFLETPRSSLVAPPLIEQNLPFAINPTPVGRRSTGCTFPPEKRRRVTPPIPDSQVISNNLTIRTTPVASQPTRRKQHNTHKNRTTRQYVPFEEMQRLMSVYGPIKTPRKSKNSPDECGTAGTAKPDSIRRKFYRWFPDFEERFVRNTDGLTYRPKAGHDEEVRYRSDMRNKDKEILVHKRKIGRRCDVFPL